jgi:Fe-S cluster biogenesis protein NfuA
VSDVRQRIDAALERIRPAVQMDGGDIRFVSFEDGVLHVALSGACSGCHQVAGTMTMGVERVLKSLVPEVKQVQAIGA